MDEELNSRIAAGVANMRDWHEKKRLGLLCYSLAEEYGLQPGDPWYETLSGIHGDTRLYEADKRLYDFLVRSSKKSKDGLAPLPGMEKLKRLLQVKKDVTANNYIDVLVLTRWISLVRRTENDDEAIINGRFIVNDRIMPIEKTLEFNPLYFHVLFQIAAETHHTRERATRAARIVVDQLTAENCLPDGSGSVVWNEMEKRRHLRHAGAEATH